MDKNCAYCMEGELVECETVAGARQFWIANEEFIEAQSVIIGTVCFIEKYSYGLAFHYFEHGTKREFQIGKTGIFESCGKCEGPGCEVHDRSCRENGSSQRRFCDH